MLILSMVQLSTEIHTYQDIGMLLIAVARCYNDFQVIWIKELENACHKVCDKATSPLYCHEACALSKLRLLVEEKAVALIDRPGGIMDEGTVFDSVRVK